MLSLKPNEANRSLALIFKLKDPGPGTYVVNGLAYPRLRTKSNLLS
jgi:hypothetical protein